MRTNDKWNGKHGKRVDIGAEIAARSQKSPAFKAAIEEVQQGHDLARKLAELREASGLTQRELAKKLHTSQAAISRLERSDYTGHTISMLRRYVEALGASMSINFRRLA